MFVRYPFTVVLIVLVLLAGCEGVQPTATPVPPTATLMSPTAMSASPTASSSTGRPSDRMVDVPQRNAPTLDGILSPGEWDGARQERFSDGSELLLMHDEGYLYLGLRADAKGTISGNIYLDRGNEIAILHSSAALGTATYERVEDGWQQTRDFVWRCRDTTNSPTAQKERETFLQEEHWVASNARMGTPEEIEYQIEMPGGSLRLAVTYIRAADLNTRIHWPTGLDDDCLKTFQGGLPKKLQFSPEKWATVRVLTAAATPVGAATPTVKAIVPEMVLVEPGSFQMGSADGESDERPVHTVQITRPFYIARYELTFDQYDQFCDETIGKNRPPDYGRGRGAQPVAVSWYEAVAYCNWLSEKHGLTPCYSGKGRLTQCDFAANGYRLPTEAEWEYAACGGQESRGYKYAGSNDVDEVAWYGGNSGGWSHPMGQKKPNELGLYDMSGNASEWCWDWYGETYYASSPASDPTGLAAGNNPGNVYGSDRVLRGSNWKQDPYFLRVTFRGADGEAYPSGGGFRLARTK